MENDSEAEFNGKEHCGVCYVVFLREMAGKKGWCHALAIPDLSQYHEEIKRWEKLSN